MIRMISKVSVENYLINIGIMPSLKGFAFLREAIPMYHEGMTITKELYPTIGRKHGISSSRVERAIRHAIEVAYSNNFLADKAPINRHGKLSNGEFISYVNLMLSRETKE